MEASFYKKEGKRADCRLCPHKCGITEGRKGLCRVRKNQGGKLKSLVYAKPVAVNTDPIEKKPLYHFLPGSKSFSIGTAGCNLACAHCQNWDISCAEPETVESFEMLPEKVVEMALARGCSSISYTYNEPTVFIEYALDCARLAREKGLKNVLVSNGFISPEPARELCSVMDAANIDLKAFNDDFYINVCKGRLQPVLDALKIYSERIWVEITNLVIDGRNDDIKEIEAMAKWISENLGRTVPLHFSRAFPMYKMQDMPATPENTLLAARQVAKSHLDYVYVGNTGLDSSTICPKCGAESVKRHRYETELLIEGNKCACGHEVAGVF